MKRIARVKKITSSSEWMWPLSFFSACNVLNASGVRIWNSGKPAPAWIRFDLGSCNVCRIELLAKIFGPGGNVGFRILTGYDHLETAYTFNGFVVDDEWIVVSLKRRTRFVEILTVSSPCWVAWKCVRIYTEHV
jgi:hypothetical protein